MRATYTTIILIVFVLAGAFFYLPQMASANDLEDKISTYTDDPISADHNLGENVNVKAKKLAAKSKAKKIGGETNKKGGDTNTNSVVLGAGSNIHGDIIILPPDK
jgi:hypothetical protein